MSRMCVVLGGGGHAASVIDAMLSTGRCTPRAVLDREPTLWGQDVCGVPVIGSDDKLSEIKSELNGGFVVGVGAPGYTPLRRDLYAYGQSLDLEGEIVIHATANVSPWAQIGAGTVILAGATVGPRTKVGENAIVNTAAVVEHDCEVSDHAHVATGAILAGGVQIGQDAFIGAGAVIRNGIRVGSRAIVGAGAVVVSDVGEDSMVVGNPAKVRASVESELN